jgi:hypothetical protein
VPYRGCIIWEWVSYMRMVRIIINHLIKSWWLRFKCSIKTLPYSINSHKLITPSIFSNPPSSICSFSVCSTLAIHIHHIVEISVTFIYFCNGTLDLNFNWFKHVYSCAMKLKLLRSMAFNFQIQFTQLICIWICKKILL